MTDLKKILKIMPKLVLLGGIMFTKSIFASSDQPMPGLEANELKPCSSKPNCVCSINESDKDHYIAPFEHEKIDQLWAKLKENLSVFGLTLVESKENYIHATATTRILRFTDDVEFLYQPDKKKIQIRSASRLGYSDLGTNRKRLEDIRLKLHQSTLL